jgi:hypothetical protein
MVAVALRVRGAEDSYSVVRIPNRDRVWSSVRTHGLCRVKAQSSGFAAQVNRRKAAGDLYVPLSPAVPQVPLIRSPGAAQLE